MKVKNNNKRTGKSVKNTRIMGKGDYSSAKSMVMSVLKEALPRVKPIVRKALVSGGGVLGSVVGSKFGAGSLGGSIGSSLGAKLSRLIGSGDYKVNDCVSNSLMGNSKNGGYAEFRNDSHSIRIQHREYLQDLVVPLNASFFTESFPINPGLVYSFPYLANVASNFEEYRVKGLVYEFISTTSPYNTNSAMGSIIMSMEYNAAAPSFTSKPQMENSDFAISARPDKNMMYGVECDVNSQNTYYVRSTATSIPLTSTDLGKFQIGAALPPGLTNVNIGEVWVTYDIELLRPRISPARYGYYHLRSINTAAAAGTFPIGGGVVSSVSVAALNGVTSGFVGGVTTLQFPNAIIGDTYQVSCHCLATQLMTAVPAVTLSNFTNTPILSNNTLATGATANNGPPGNFTLIGFYTVSSLSGVPAIQFTSIGVGAAGTITSDIFITDIGNGLTVDVL